MEAPDFDACLLLFLKSFQTDLWVIPRQGGYQPLRVVWEGDAPWAQLASTSMATRFIYRHWDAVHPQRLTAKEYDIRIPTRTVAWQTLDTMPKSGWTVAQFIAELERNIAHDVFVSASTPACTITRLSRV